MNELPLEVRIAADANLFPIAEIISVNGKGYHTRLSKGGGAFLKQTDETENLKVGHAFFYRNHLDGVRQDNTVTYKEALTPEQEAAYKRWKKANGKSSQPTMKTRLPGLPGFQFE